MKNSLKKNRNAFNETVYESGNYAKSKKKILIKKDTPTQI